MSDEVYEMLKDLGRANLVVVPEMEMPDIDLTVDPPLVHLSPEDYSDLLHRQACEPLSMW